MQWTRRLFLTAGCCVCHAPLAAQFSWGKEPGKLADVEGCFVPERYADLLRSQKLVLGSLTSGEANFSNFRRTTGDPEMDSSLDRALKRLADTFGVYPGVGFYDDGDSPNAWATTKQFVPNTSGTVVFGQNYFRRWMNYDPSGVSVLATFAHEFGHIMQYNSGEYSRIQGGQPTSKRIELHADYMSGFYVGRLKKDNPTASFWKAGDKFRRVGDYDYKNPKHHGTPEDRVNASREGFNIGFATRQDAKSSFQSGVEYVSRL
jgi:hypothetical protein